MLHHKLVLSLLKEEFAVCRLPNDEPMPEWSKNNVFLSITQTADELSVVCPESHVPDNVKKETGWRIFKVAVPLDFSLTGILAAISTVLANKSVSIFAISTYDTDYILVKNRDVEDAVKALVEAGYDVK